MHVEIRIVRQMSGEVLGFNDPLFRAAIPNRSAKQRRAELTAAHSGHKMGCIVADPSWAIRGATLPYLAIDIGDLKNLPIPPSRLNAVTCICGRYLTAIMSSPMS